MTAMRNGVYALLAVVVGVMLVGMLPGQLSNLAAPTVETASLQSTPRAGNFTSSGYGSTPSRYNDSTVSNDTAFSIVSGDTVVTSSAASAASAAGTKSDAASAQGAAFVIGEGYTDPYADLRYYGFWGVGLVAALGVYFAAKRLLG
ncbi:MAG: hypothetical protein NTV61_11085 [Candidatus Bathyarchaeota archaeon]|nr:hypothetical protein [Candidatus Bathyarchaeota archaeon]